MSKEKGTPVDPVKAYEEGIKKRNEARKRQKAPTPNLATIAKMYDPAKGGPATIAQLGQQLDSNMQAAQRQEGSRLSKQTLEGLQALKEEVKRVEATKPAAEPAARAAESEPNINLPKLEEPTKEKRKLTREELESALDEMDEIDRGLLESRANSDLVNSRKEREFIEKQLKPLNIEDGLISGEYRQVVPVKPGVLNVEFRSVTPLESEAVRQILIKNNVKNPQEAVLAGDRMGLMLMTCSIVKINGSPLPNHLKGQYPSLTFDEDLFRQKLALVQSYPAPMITALLANAYWFDLRVQSLFRNIDTLKNG